MECNGFLENDLSEICFVNESKTVKASNSVDPESNLFNPSSGQYHDTRNVQGINSAIKTEKIPICEQLIDYNLIEVQSVKDEDALEKSSENMKRSQHCMKMSVSIYLLFTIFPILKVSALIVQIVSLQSLQSSSVFVHEILKWSSKTFHEWKTASTYDLITEASKKILFLLLGQFILAMRLIPWQLHIFLKFFGFFNIKHGVIELIFAGYLAFVLSLLEMMSFESLHFFTLISYMIFIMMAMLIKDRRRSLSVILMISLMLSMFKFVAFNGTKTMVTLFKYDLSTSLSSYDGTVHERQAKRVTRVAESVGFPTNRIYMISDAKDCYVSTFFYDYIKLNSHHIVCDGKTTLGILSHELGHWSAGDIYTVHAQQYLSYLFEYFLTCLVYQNANLFSVFGEFDSPYVAVAIAKAVANHVMNVFEPLMLDLSRKQETRADKFSGEIGYGNELINYLKVNSNIPNVLCVHDFYKIMYLTHPPMDERIPNIIKTIDQKLSH